MRQVCWAIVGRTKMYMSEACICDHPDPLADYVLDCAKEEEPDEDYQIVPLFTRRHAPKEKPGG